MELFKVPANKNLDGGTIITVASFKAFVFYFIFVFSVYFDLPEENESIGNLFSIVWSVLKVLVPSLGVFVN